MLRDARAALAAGDKFAALAAWQKAAALPAQFGPGEDSPQRLAADLQAAGIDPSRLQPAAANPASPYTLRPSDLPQTADRFPNLSGPSGPPAAALPPGGLNPYNLPADNNPLAEGLRGGGAFQPTAPAEGPPPAGPSQFQPVSAPYAGAGAGPANPGAEEPRRLPAFDPAKKGEAGRLVAQARIALDKGDLRTAQQLAEQAQNMNIPDEAFAAEETRPWQLLLDVNRAMYRREGVVPASGTMPASASGPEPRYPVAQGLYDPAADKSQNVRASSQAAIGGNQPPQGSDLGYKLYDEGLKALEQQDREGALAKFTEAWKFQDQLDPAVRQQLKDKLLFMRAAADAQPLPASVGPPSSPLAQVTSQQQILLQKLDREIVNEERLAEKLAENDPRGAIEKMQKLRERVAAAEIDPAGKKQLLARIDPRVRQLEIYIEQNKSTIENDERNAAVRAEMTRNQDVLIQSQNKLAEMVEQFNKLMDEQRYPEAEVVARQARDMSGPNDQVVTLMLEKAKLARACRADVDEAAEGSRRPRRFGRCR